MDAPDFLEIIEIWQRIWQVGFSIRDDLATQDEGRVVLWAVEQLRDGDLDLVSFLEIRQYKNGLRTYDFWWKISCRRYEWDPCSTVGGIAWKSFKLWALRC